MVTETLEESKRAGKQLRNCCGCLVAQPWGTLATPCTAARQAPLFMGSSRQEYWSVLPCPPPGDLPNTGIKPRSPAVWAGSLPAEPPEKPLQTQETQETQVRSLGPEDPLGEGNGNPFWYSCLENPMNRGAWRAAVHGVKKSQKGLSD